MHHQFGFVFVNVSGFQDPGSEDDKHSLIFYARICWRLLLKIPQAKHR